jgi:hypothetical protein
MKFFSVLFVLGIFSLIQAQLIKEGNIVKDTKTNFLWQDSKESKTLKVTWKEGQKYCQNLTLDGMKGWTMPGFAELFSIVNTKLYNPTLSKAFEHFETKDYWTTKMYSHGVNNQAFVIEFKGGAFNRKDMDSKFNIRCYKKQ